MVYTFEPEGSGMQFTLEHIPGDISKVPIVGGALENFITLRHQKFAEDFKQHTEARQVNWSRRPPRKTNGVAVSVSGKRHLTAHVCPTS